MSSPTALQLIARHVPAWVFIRKYRVNRLAVSARPIDAGGIEGRSYNLLIEETDAGEIEVREDGYGQLPTFCPQRHINSDQSFCLGYRAEIGISTPESAISWWQKVELYLLCQDTAAESGFWPRYAELAHGDAAIYQFAAETAAQILGKEADLLQARSGRGWIVDNQWLVNPDRKRLLNGRLPCLCGYKGRRGRPYLRRECRKKKKICLVLTEANWQAAEADFWRSHKKRACCGTMHDCPLKRKS